MHHSLSLLLKQKATFANVPFIKLSGKVILRLFYFACFVQNFMYATVLELKVTDEVSSWCIIMGY